MSNREKTVKTGRAAEREAQSRKTGGDEERKASKERDLMLSDCSVSTLAPRPPVAHHRRTKPGLLGLGVAVLTPPGIAERTGIAVMELPACKRDSRTLSHHHHPQLPHDLSARCHLLVVHPGSHAASGQCSCRARASKQNRATPARPGMIAMALSLSAITHPLPLPAPGLAAAAVFKQTPA